ncbi:MAG: hypothetical protein FJ202_01935 [Gemmatimonadetes bacterium]|nr:hypothetical protein [Gemmatimonadota bacterium]
MTDELEKDPRLKRLRELTAALPREIEPAGEAWDAIRSRIDASRVRTITDVERSPATEAPSATPIAGRAPGVHAARWRLAAAAVLIVGATGWLLSRTSGRTPAPETELVSARYETTARELEAEMARQLSALPPATQDVVKQSLAAIDVALGDLRRALAGDPKNAALEQYLVTTYERKLDFIRRVRTLGSAM